MKKTKNSIRLPAFVGTLLIFGCNGIQYFDTPVKVDLLNELQGCEEQNIHYTILRIHQEEFKDYNGKIVFVELDSKIESDSLYSLLFPAVTEKRLKVTVEGLLSKNVRKGRT